MIVTVTMNPAIDKTVEINTLERGGLNRIKTAVYDAGGKGVNVSKTIKELGGKTLATGFLGGNAGRTIDNILDGLGIETDFVWVDGETRTNTKVFEENGMLTELNEHGCVVPLEKINELMAKLEKLAGEDVLFVLSGSIPAGVSKDIYGEITKMAHSKGAAVLLDADGELFRNSIGAIPDIIKPNRVELEEYVGMDDGADDKELLKIADDFVKKGIKTVAVSMGGDGAIILHDGIRVKCPVLNVKAHSTVGAGDAMVAALAYAWENKLSHEETVKMCMAVSAGAVTTIGTKPPSRELVDELMKQVIIENI
ncbi:MAG: 1-phosphofructokinase [bacterium]|nr:1-phosphofructokinase [bacterium]